MLLQQGQDLFPSLATRWYLASLFEQTPGPILAVGQSYGGAVITNAAARATNVVGLVSRHPQRSTLHP